MRLLLAFVICMICVISAERFERQLPSSSNNLGCSQTFGNVDNGKIVYDGAILTCTAGYHPFPGNPTVANCISGGWNAGSLGPCVKDPTSNGCVDPGETCAYNSDALCQTQCTSYNGTKSVTKTGKNCINWNDVKGPKYTGACFPNNYCRSSSSYGPWCYVTVGGSWEYCFDNCPKRTKRQLPGSSSVDCGTAFGSVPNGVITYTSASLICNPGFHPSSGSSATAGCLSPGIWNVSSMAQCAPDPPACTGYFGSVPNGAVTYTASVTCNSGYHAQPGLSTTATYSNGGSWSSSSLAQCIPDGSTPPTTISCVLPPTMPISDGCAFNNDAVCQSSCGYNGFKNTSKNGKPCLPWAGTKYNSGCYINNYCRGDSTHGPWCYLAEGSWDYCFETCPTQTINTCVYPGETCAFNDNRICHSSCSYNGTKTTTKTGKPCLPWAGSKYTGGCYINNYCRGDSAYGPWCYTTAGGSWEYCFDTCQNSVGK